MLQCYVRIMDLMEVNVIFKLLCIKDSAECLFYITILIKLYSYQ